MTESEYPPDRRYGIVPNALVRDCLPDIDPDSPQEFEDWIGGKHPKRTPGGHPWEIKRGGNTTHIDLAVMRPLPGVKQGFKVELCGNQSGEWRE